MIALHHVQVSAPPGGEDACRGFYAHALGLVEVPKPAALMARGGCWFRTVGDAGRVSAEIHVGIEVDFHPQVRAHPALLVTDLAAVAERLRLGGHEVDESERDNIEGYWRLHTRDPHGNRVEVLQARDS